MSPPYHTKGKAEPMNNSNRIRVAIAGLGNCASSLIEGIHYYRQNPGIEMGLLFPTLSGMAGIDTKTTGVFTRAERTLVLVIGILIGKLTIALWILAIFNSLSALQRVIHTIHISHESDRALQRRAS